LNSKIDVIKILCTINGLPLLCTIKPSKRGKKLIDRGFDIGFSIINMLKKGISGYPEHFYGIRFIQIKFCKRSELNG
jgi:hypothetical protein